MATYAIGDIHGCFTALETLLGVVQPGPRDTLVFLGDYVDRGPNSAHVIELINSLPSDRTFTLLGNHEIMMMAFRDQVPESENWLEYGGAETLLSYGIDVLTDDWSTEIPLAHWQFMEDALPYYEIEGFILVHAGVDPGVSMSKQTPQALFWNKLIDPRPYDSETKVICGHTAQTDGYIADYGHTICIDTYAYGDQWLTCLDVEWGAFWQANQSGEVREGRLQYGVSNPL